MKFVHCAGASAARVLLVCMEPRQVSAIVFLESIQRQAAYGILRCQSPSQLPRQKDMDTSKLLGGMGWNRLSLRRQVALLRLLARVLNDPPAHLRDYVRKNRSGRLQLLLGRTEHQKSMLFPRATELWCSLSSGVTQGPFEEKEHIKEFCKCATLNLE